MSLSVLSAVVKFHSPAGERMKSMSEPLAATARIPGSSDEPVGRKAESWIEESCGNVKSW
jgi:hypothetical protein